MIINAGLNGGQTPYGQNMELVGNFFSRDIAFKDTDYNGWTPSTTQTIIVDNLVTDTFNADMANYGYMAKWIIDIQMAYSSGDNKSRPYRFVGEILNFVSREPKNVTSFVQENNNYFASIGSTASRYLFYYDGNGSKKRERGSSYGVGITLLSNDPSDYDNDNITVTPRNPQIWVRCNSTRFSTANAALLDQDNSVIKLRGSLYRMEPRSWYLFRSIDHVIDLYNNPL